MISIDVLLFRFLLVIIIGGLIGAERELKSKSAGLRTIMMICMGSFLFTTFSIWISPQTPDRIASNIVTGIGFLGAGVIFKIDNHVNGLTTAATIWITAALGMGVATGEYLFVGIATVIALSSLHFLGKIERQIEKITQTMTYKITTTDHENMLKTYETLFEEYHLKFKRDFISKDGADIMSSWILQGSENNHSLLTKMIFRDHNVKKIEII